MKRIACVRYISLFLVTAAVLNREVSVDASSPYTVTISFERAPYNSHRYRHDYYEVQILDSADQITTALNHTTGRNIPPIALPKVCSRLLLVEVIRSEQLNITMIITKFRV